MRGGIAKPEPFLGGIFECVRDRATERAAIKACRIESKTPAGNRACLSAAHVSAVGNQVLASVWAIEPAREAKGEYTAQTEN